MEQTNTSGTEQSRIFYGCEASEVRPHLGAAKHGCPTCRGAGWMRVDSPYGDPSFGKSTPCSCTQERQKTLAPMADAPVSESGGVQRLHLQNLQLSHPWSARSCSVKSHIRGTAARVAPVGRALWLRKNAPGCCYREPEVRVVTKRFSTPPSLICLTRCVLPLSLLNIHNAQCLDTRSRSVGSR